MTLIELSKLCESELPLICPLLGPDEVASFQGGICTLVILWVFHSGLNTGVNTFQRFKLEVDIIGACTIVPVSGMPISSSTVTVREESSAITDGRLAQTVTLIGVSSDS